MTTTKWIDLRDNIDKAKLKIASMHGEDGRQRHFLFITGLSNKSVRWARAIAALGFASSPNARYLSRLVRDGEQLKAAMFHPVWPNAMLAQMNVEDVRLDLTPSRHARESLNPRSAEERRLAADVGVITRFGRNGDGGEVFLTAAGRMVRREDGSTIYESAVLGPQMFLRAPDERALDLCADGFVHAMVMGEVQHSADMDRFIHAVTDRPGPYDAPEYERISSVIDAAIVRFLDRTYETAQDAYGDAARLFQYLPPYLGAQRGQAAMPIPLAVIAQRLLGDTSGKRVLVPNAWDGASFAFLARQTRICAFRGHKDLSRSVDSLRKDDVTWSDDFDPAREQGADGLFFNADPVLDEAGSRQDYRQALGALRTLNPGGRAVMVLAGDDPLLPGALSDEGRQFITALSRRYDIEAAVETSAPMSRNSGARQGLRIIALRNRPAQASSLKVERFPVVHTWDELKSHVDEVIASIDLREAQSEGVDVDAVARENDFQRPYVAFSKVGEAVTMVPKNLQGPLQIALSTVQALFGPVDGFVERELGFGENTLQDRFSPEQVDAIALGLTKLKAGRGFIIGDETGIGKGRVIGALATWAQKQGQDIIFVTDRANLFSDLVRDLRDIGEFGRFRPLVMNADGVLVDVITNEVLRSGTPAKEMARIVEGDLTLENIQCNIVFTTYSQISAEDSAKGEWLLSRANNALVIVDEAHVAAGSNSNTSNYIVDLISRASAVVYSSATWAKSSENLHIYSRAFPETINTSSLSDTMRSGGEPFSEVFSAMLATDGAFIRREHDLSKIEFVVEVDTQRTRRNSDLSDKLSEVLAAMTFVSGELNKLLLRRNSETLAVLKNARAAREAASSVAAQAPAAEAHAEAGAHPARARRARGNLLKSSFGAGSVLYQVMRRFLSVLNSDHVVDLALKAVQENRKPVIVFEDTGEIFVKRLIEQQVIPGIDGEPDTLPTAVRPPNIKDLLRNVMMRLGVVTIESVDEAVLATATERRAQQDEQAQEAIDLDAVVMEQDTAVQGGRGITIDLLPGLTPEQQQFYRDGMEQIMKMIDELPPMPLNAVDVMRARMTDAGLRTGELSGRSLVLEAPPEQRNTAIDDRAWEGFKWTIVPRARKKSEVNRLIWEFNNGEVDVMFINRSAATGTSLHSSRRFGDQRRRELIELQIPENPTDRIQLYGRVNRYDQVVTPRIAIATTGIFGEVRQIMMQNKKLARLSANIRSSRENAAEIRSIPDLLNPVGQVICKRFLEDNGGVRNRLGLTEEDLERGRLDVVSRVTSRVALLRVAEQKMVYDEMYDLYADEIARHEMAGTNPLKAREMDVRAKVERSELVIGVEMNGVGSAFDGPVYLKKLSWQEDRHPVSWEAFLHLVINGRRHLLRDGLAAELPAPPADAKPLGVEILGVMLDARGQPADCFAPAAALDGSALMDMFSPMPDYDATQYVRHQMEAAGMAHLEGGPGLDEPAQDAGAIRDTGDFPYRPGGAEMALMTNLRVRELERNVPRINLAPAARNLAMILQAKTRIELVGSGYVDVAQALEDKKDNAVKRAYAKALWVQQYMGSLIPGTSVILRDAEGKGARDWLNSKRYVVTGVEPPAKGKESMLARWKVLMLRPGDDKPVAFSLQTIMGTLHLGEGLRTREEGGELCAYSNNIIDGDIFEARPDLGQAAPHGARDLFGQDAPELMRSFSEVRVDSMRRDFTSRRAGQVTRTALVLDGNMYLASEWAAATKKGQGIIFSDERGIRHRAVLMREDHAGDMMTHMPVRLWAPAMIRELVRRSARAPEEGQASFDAAEMTFATNIQGAINPLGGEGTRFLVLPGKGVALSVNKKELSRITRALRASLKAQLRLEHPEFKTYDPERKKQVEDSTLCVKSSAKKGRRPVIFIECESDEQSDKAVDLVCKSSGIEIYVPRGSRMGALADTIQREYFEQRRLAAQDVLDRARMGNAAEAAPVANLTSHQTPAGATDASQAVDGAHLNDGPGEFQRRTREAA